MIADAVLTRASMPQLSAAVPNASVTTPAISLASALKTR